MYLLTTRYSPLSLAMLSQQRPDSVEIRSQLTEAPAASDEDVISWTVHLARRNAGAIPKLMAAMLAAGLLVTILFHSPLPGLVAILLLMGSVKEFLFPIHYRITTVGVESRSVGSRLELAWKDVRRCMLEPTQITLTPLSKPGRLDVFRGVTLRFADVGEPGDREAVLTACRRQVPELIVEASYPDEEIA